MTQAYRSAALGPISTQFRRGIAFYSEKKGRGLAAVPTKEARKAC